MIYLTKHGRIINMITIKLSGEQFNKLVEYVKEKLWEDFDDADHTETQAIINLAESMGMNDLAKEFSDLWDEEKGQHYNDNHLLT